MANTFKDNQQQTPTSNSAMHNGAAKDDTVTLSADGIIALDQILANDPGSAIYQDLDLVVTGTGSVVYDPDSETFQVEGDVSSFVYTIRLANGTYSTATVTLEDGGPGTLADVLFEDTFSGYTTAPVWGIGDLATNGWTGTTNAEIVAYGYQGLLTGTDPDGYWLDTQASPGGIDISHVVQDANAGNALISFTAAYQQFDGWVATGELEFLWNGVVVKSISTADFAAGNQFLDFSVVVNSDIDGENILQIRDTGIDSYVGFALDSVTVNDWIIV